MIEINIESNLRAVEAQLGEFQSQVPFAGSVAMNKTMTDVQKYLRTVTIPRAWTTRNKSLSKAIVGRRTHATKRKMIATISPVRGRDGRLAGEGFLDRQYRGSTKIAKRNQIAVPVIQPGLRRLKSGAISKTKRPLNNKKLIKVSLGQNKALLLERQKRRKEAVVRYVLTPKARGTNRLQHYHRDAHRVVTRVLGGHWRTAINRAVRNARTKHR